LLTTPKSQILGSARNTAGKKAPANTSGHPEKRPQTVELPGRRRKKSHSRSWGHWQQQRHPSKRTHTLAKTRHGVMSVTCVGEIKRYDPKTSKKTG